jgi:hypothetical protein
VIVMSVGFLSATREKGKGQRQSPGRSGVLDVIAFGRSARALGRTCLHPIPIADLGHVVAVLVDVLLVLDQLLMDRLLEIRGAGTELRSQ